MEDGEWFQGKRVTVMGLGLHGGGLGVAAWLLRHGARVTVTDLKDEHVLARSVRKLEREYTSLRRRGIKVYRVRYVLGRHERKDFSHVDMVIQNPGVPKENLYLNIARKHAVPVETDVSLFFFMCPFPIVAVTGTKGKTTTTALLGEMCLAKDKRTVIAGNIRVSVMNVLDRLLARAKRGESFPPIVLEISSWQVEGLRQHKLYPHVGVVTNIRRDHLNRYRGIVNYTEAKRGLLAFQKKGDYAVLNYDDPRVARMARKQHRIFWFSLRRLPAELDGCFVQSGKIILRDEGKFFDIIPVSTLRIPGEHNIANALAACAGAHAYGVPISAIQKGLRQFRGVPGRFETIAKKMGIHFINDTTATAPVASIAAMNTLAGKEIILLSGGADKDLDFCEWAQNVKRHVKHLVLFGGSATEKIERALEENGVSVSIGRVNSMREAVREALRHAKRGDVVLLSPGCASFGVFTNEFDRGDQFEKEVRRCI